MIDTGMPTTRKTFEDVARETFYGLEMAAIDDRFLAIANCVLNHQSMRELIVRAIDVASNRQLRESDPQHKRTLAILITDLQKCEAWLSFAVADGGY